MTGLAMTGDINKALQMAGQGAIFGGIAGAAIGGYKGFRDARAAGTNPWTGKPGIPDKLYHYTNSANTNNIDANGINTSSDGNVYSTPESNYTSQQAIKSLNLNPEGGARDALYQIDVKGLANDGIVPVSLPTPVPGGTGYEVKFNKPIPPKYLIRLK